jgi:TP901 family phage tail tape measure protein
MAAELQLLVSLRDEASAQLKQINDTLESNTKSWRDNFGAIQNHLKQTSMALIGFGAAITGALGYAYKQSEEDRLSLARLDNTLKNVGVSYESLATSIDKQVESARKTTGISKNEQIDALNQLIMTTGDYKKSLELLPVALDLAKAKQMDVTQSALLLGRMAEGDINVLNRYGFSMDGVKDAAVALDMVQRKVAGSAADSMSPFDVLKTSLEELGSTIGNLITPEITKLIKFVSNVVDKFTEWATKNPELAGWLTDIALAMGVAAIAAGVLTAAVIALAIAKTALTWEIDLVILAIVALIAIIVLLILKWDEIEKISRDTWDKIKLYAFIAGGVLGYVFTTLIQWASIFTTHWDKAKGFWENIWNGIKAITLGYVNDILDAVEGFINGILTALDWLASKINDFGKLLGQDWNLNVSTRLDLPNISEKDWGIWNGIRDANVWDYYPTIPTAGGVGGTAPVDSFGNYGNPGTTYNLGGVSINIEGSNLNADEIAEKVRQQILLLQTRNANSSGITP